MLKKVISLIVVSVFLFSSSGVIAQPKYETTIIDFSKGLNTHLNIWNLPKNQASVARNVRFNRQYSSVSKRLTMISGGVISTTYAGTSIHRYYQTDGTAQLLATGSTFIRLRDDSDLSYSTIRKGLTDGKRWTWVTFEGKAIGGNGSDAATKYDGSTSITANTTGHRTAEYLCADLGAPFVELATGTTLTAARWFAYMVAWYDDTTYSYSTARSNPILTGADVRSLYLRDIPIGPTGTTHRYIFRTPAHTSAANCIGEADADFLMVKDLNDNTTVVWADDIADGSEPDTTNWATVSAGDEVTPPNCKFWIIHQNRLFAAGDTTAGEKSYIYWSDEFNPDYFAVADYDRIREDDGDDITLLMVQNNILAVGKTNTVQNYYTTAASETDWYPSNPFTHDGCIAPYSPSNTPLGIFYLSHSGWRRYTGQASQLISDAVTPEIQDILESNLGEVVGFFWKNEAHLSYTSSASGETINNRVLVYDIIRDAHTLDYKNINAFCALSSGSDYGILYSVSSDTDGQVYAHEGAPATLIKKYKSEIDAGTFDSTVTTGTESEPVLDIGWDITIDEAVGTIDGHAYGATAIIDRDATSGTWESEVYQVNASSFDELYWNESLGATGNVIIEMKVCDDSACSGESYGSDYSDPSGSDISAESANDYVKFKASFSTTDINYSPYLYVLDGFMIKMVYGKEGSTNEADFLSIWTGGWTDLDLRGKVKRIDRIKVYYKSTASTMTINYKNEEGDVDNSFDINLAQIPPFTEADTDNQYYGVGSEKCYVYYPPANEDGEEPSGQWWMFSLQETGSDVWHTARMEIRSEVLKDVD